MFPINYPTKGIRGHTTVPVRFSALCSSLPHRDYTVYDVTNVGRSRVFSITGRTGSSCMNTISVPMPFIKQYLYMYRNFAVVRRTSEAHQFVVLETTLLK